MLQEAKDLQKNAVTQLVKILENDKKEITFKAPTGSGKTFMMADFMNRVISKKANAVFIVSTLSKSNLAEQNFLSFKNLSENGTFQNINPFLINSDSSGEGSIYIPTDYNVYVLPRDLYKDSAKLKKEGTFLNFLETLRGNEILNSNQKQIFLIKDECHIATSNLDELKNYFTSIINFSATPKLNRKQFPDVEITNTQAQEVHLIKQIQKGNDEDSLNDALNKFEEIKKDYANELNVNPCFIIQISNKEKAEEELKNTIKPALLNHQELKWLYINDKGGETNDSGLQKLPVSKWKNFIKEAGSTISVIIFKMVISEGYDIPRACMLYQIRDSKSKQLDEQVTGRVRRNPRLLDFETLSENAKNLASTAWIWGIIPKNENEPKQVELFSSYNIEQNLKIKPVKLKNITNSKNTDLQNYVKNLSDNKIAYTSIFELYKKINSKSDEIQNLCWQYSTDFSKWKTFTEHLDEVKKTYDDLILDYEKSMCVCQEVSFPYTSEFIDSTNTLTLDDWVWKRKDNSTNFSFDSLAEKMWAEELKDIRKDAIQTSSKEENALFEDAKFLWGKNFPYNSEIKYEYYSDGIHSSYPDYVLKDKKGRIHIFEVKSVNKSSSLKIDENEYAEKVRAIKKCYQECSKKTGYIFYLPILKDSSWQITKYTDGKESVISLEEFKKGF